MMTERFASLERQGSNVGMGRLGFPFKVKLSAPHRKAELLKMPE